ncbi:MAG: hypothetical protein MI923_23255 [Phycisphaerales bacterium]|nr:hypothetical protein [Phycisphaerales bacterium]
MRYAKGSVAKEGVPVSRLGWLAKMRARAGERTKFRARNLGRAAQGFGGVWCSNVKR